jgi:hypothetical protein
LLEHAHRLNAFSFANSSWWSKTQIEVFFSTCYKVRSILGNITTKPEPKFWQRLAQATSLSEKTLAVQHNNHLCKQTQQQPISVNIKSNSKNCKGSKSNHSWKSNKDFGEKDVENEVKYQNIYNDNIEIKKVISHKKVFTICLSFSFFILFYGVGFSDTIHDSHISLR